MFGIGKINSKTFSEEYNRALKNIPRMKESKMVEREMKPLSKAMNAVLTAKTNSPTQWYMREIQYTVGDYRTRDTNVFVNVQRVVEKVEDSIKHDVKRLIDTPYGMIIKLFKNLVGNQRAIKGFNSAFRDSKKVISIEEPSMFFVSLYTAMVYTLESLTLYIAAEYENIIDMHGKASVDRIDYAFGNQNPGYTRNVLLPATRLIAYVESIDVDKEYAMVKKQYVEAKRSYSKESFRDDIEEGKGEPSFSDDELDEGDTPPNDNLEFEKSNRKLGKEEVSEESIIATIGTAIGIIGLVLFTGWGLIAGIRHIVYWMKTVPYDISALLKEEIDFLEINIRELEERAEKTNDPKEKERINRIVERQKKARENFIKKVRKIQKDEALYANSVQEDIKAADKEIEDGDSHAPDVTMTL